MITDFPSGNFEFRKVGQGSFYTGQICQQSDLNTSSNFFSFVYDCGSKSGKEFIKTEISDFKLTLGEKKLHTLFLSHLDEDHVNYVRELLQDITCEQVILPYLAPFERLIVALSCIDRYTIDKNDTALFLFDPASYLLSYHVREIVFIFGNSDNREAESNNPEGNAPDDITGLNIRGLEDSNQIALPSEIEQLNKNSKIKFKKGNGKGLYKKIWEFYIHYQKARIPNNIDELKKKIEEVFRIKINQEGQLESEQLRTILESEKLKELREFWKDTFLDTNTTGIVIQHKPVNYNTAQIFMHPKIFRSYYSEIERRKHMPYIFKWEATSNETKGATLLTGDTCINQMPYSDYIKKHMDGILVLQIPHHGSKKGFTGKMLHGFNSQKHTTAVINFGWGNHYVHPSSVCIKELRVCNFDILFCNQIDGFEYYIFVNYK